MAPAVQSRNNFDLIRLGAALQVVIYHSTLVLGGRAPQALYRVQDAVPGVPIFFMVSGFLITGALLRGPSVREYVRNRALRIYPALWCCLALTVGLVLASGVIAARYLATPHGVAWIAGQVTVATGTPGPVRAFGTGTPNDSLWSIPVELQFYVVAAVIALGLAARGGRRWSVGPLLAAAGLASFAVATLASWHFGFTVTGASRLLNATALPWFWQFALGALARVYLPRLQPMIRLPLLWWAAAVGWYVVVTHGLTSAVIVQLQTPIEFGLLGGAVLATAFARPQTAGQVLRGVDLSYGVYLYHFLIINSLVQWTDLRGWAADAVVVVGALAVAALSWWGVEKPALRRKHSRTPAVAPARTPALVPA